MSEKRKQLQDQVLAYQIEQHNLSSLADFNLSSATRLATRDDEQPFSQRGIGAGSSQRDMRIDARLSYLRSQNQAILESPLRNQAGKQFMLSSNEAEIELLSKMRHDGSEEAVKTAEPQQKVDREENRAQMTEDILMAQLERARRAIDTEIGGDIFLFEAEAEIVEL